MAPVASSKCAECGVVESVDAVHAKGTGSGLGAVGGAVVGAIVGNQVGGRVFLFLATDDFWRDYRRMIERGVRFVREPSEQPYGVVAVFEDLYGNRWDLIQYRDGHPLASS